MTVSITDVLLNDDILYRRETITVTIEFSARVMGFQASGLRVSPANGLTFGEPVQASADGTMWTVALTQAAGSDSAATCSISLVKSLVNDASGSPIGSGLENLKDFTIDSTPDTAAPEFEAVTVIGDQLVLSFNDENSLDTEHKPATGAFTVKVGAAP